MYANGVHAAGEAVELDEQQLLEAMGGRREDRPPRRSLQLHTDHVMAVAFSPDGKTIVSGSFDQTIKVWNADSLELLEERKGNAATIDKSGEVAECDGATLRLKEGGAFYAPSPLRCIAVHWPKLGAGAQSGELYHLEVEGA